MKLGIMCTTLADYRTSLAAGGQDELEHRKSLCHTRSAQKLVQLCFTNGGIYIKLGQVAAQMVCPQLDPSLVST